MSKAKSGFVDPAALLHQVRQQPGATAEAPAGPWGEGNPRVIVPFVLRLPEPLHLQLKYAAANTLGESMQTLATKAVQEVVARRLAELEKGGA